MFKKKKKILDTCYHYSKISNDTMLFATRNIICAQHKISNYRINKMLLELRYGIILERRGSKNIVSVTMKLSRDVSFPRNYQYIRDSFRDFVFRLFFHFFASFASLPISNSVAFQFRCLIKKVVPRFQLFVILT